MRGRLKQIARAGRYGNAMLQILLLLALPPFTRAADGPWSASLAATTDYVFRGVSQTYDSGALQLGVNYRSPLGWFAGAWASNVDPHPFGRTALELDLYAGFRRALGEEFNATVAYTHYQYVDDSRPVLQL